MVTTMGKVDISISSLLERTAASNNQTARTDRSDSFSGYLKSADESVSKESEQIDRASNKVATSEKLDKPEENDKPETIKELKDISEEPISEEAAESAMLVFMNLIVDISTALNAEPDQVISAMEELDMSMQDLLTSDGLTNLMTELNELSDSVEIILDSDLYSQFKNAMTVISEAIENPEVQEFMSLNTEMNTQDMLLKLRELTEKLADSSEEIVKNEMPVSVNEVNDGDAEEFVPRTDVNQVPVSEDENPQEAVVVEAGKSQGEQNPEDSGAESSDMMTGKHEALQKDDLKTVSENDQALGIKTFDSFISEMAAAEKPTAYTTSQAIDIIKQISEQMALTKKDGAVSIELTLNPESLGKVGVSVIAKDGAVTAQILAENESAKIAIESQVATLRETLNNQGIKVEAVEVAIASHTFEQNDETAHDQRNEAEEKTRQNKIGSLRFGFDDEVDETEDVTNKEMLLAEGSTVSYSA